MKALYAIACVPMFLATGQSFADVSEPDLTEMIRNKTTEDQIRRTVEERGCAIHMTAARVRTYLDLGASRGLLRWFCVREEAKLERFRALAKQFADGWDAEIKDLNARKLPELTPGPISNLIKWRGKEAEYAQKLGEVKEALGALDM